MFMSINRFGLLYGKNKERILLFFFPFFLNVLFAALSPFLLHCILETWAHIKSRG